jgi:hypothetical protein
MNGVHAMLSVVPVPDHVTANAFVVQQDVQVVMKTCPKKKNVKVMMT